jgi:hypothetical protein
LPTHLRRIIGPCPLPPLHFQHINQLTKNRSASDGSVLHYQGFQGWLIAKLDNEVLIQQFGATDGRVYDVSSYHIEIGGNIATFTVFTLIRKVYGVSPPSIEHVCDNQSTISAIWKDENVCIFDKTKPDADVAKLSRNAIADLQQHPLVTAYWAEGHVDKRGPSFSPQEELNILTDGLADKAQNLIPTDMKPRTECLHFPEEQVSIFFQQHKVTSRLPYHISNAIYGPTLTKYLSEKERWPPSVFRSIAYDSFSIAFNKLTTARKIVTKKTMYSFWCTNKRNRCDRGQHKE